MNEPNNQLNDANSKNVNEDKINFTYNLIKNFRIFENLNDKTLNLIAKNSNILSYEIGQSLSAKHFISNNILIILEGNARLLLKNTNEISTITKLTKGSIIGLGSILRNQACEEVTASNQVKVLSIPDKFFLSLYEENSSIRDFSNSLLFDGEIADLAENIIKRSNRTSLKIDDLFKILKKSISIINLNQIEDLLTTKVIFLASNNVKGKKLGELLTSKKNLVINPPFKIRLIAIEKEQYQDLIQEKEDKISSDESINNELDQYAIKGPSFPENTSINIINKPAQKTIRASGLVNESLACIQMLANDLDIPLRKEYVEKTLRDEYKRTGKISIAICGAITSTLGLYSAGVRIASNLGTRIPVNSLIPWKDSFAVVRQSNFEGITLASPKFGLINVKREELEGLYPEGIEVLFVERTNMSPEKKFNLEWFLPSLKKYRSSLVLVLIASFIVQLFGLANPLLIQVIIDKVISQRSLDTLQILGIALVVVTILGGIIGSLRTFLFTETTNRIDTRLGAEVIDHLLRLPLNYFDKRPVGELSSRVSELEKIRNFLTGQALTTILDAAFSVIYIIVMVIYSWILTIIALSVVPIQIGITLLGSPIIRRQIREVATQNAKTQSHLVEVLTGIQTVKAQNVETISRWKWQDLYSKYISRTFEKTITTTALSQTSSVLQQLSQLFVLWIGASLVLKGQLTLGQLIAFRIISGYVTQPLLRLSSIWQSIQELRVSFERLADIIDTSEESNEADKSNIPLPEIKGDISFKDVSFSFGINNPQILKKVNLDIKTGEFVGIAGQSGSGKSTLMKLLPRLYEVNEGKILIDDYDVSKTELYSSRRQIGIVPQDPLLFSGTVSDNISLTNPDVDSKEIIRASKIADAHDFIMGLPNGYSTNVGERGAGLSGGQKQRIAIARTLLNVPKLLIMDEATSALDYQTEKKVCDNLKVFCKGITVFFITHRLNTIKNADRIIMMHEGSISEMGTHEDLMERKGRYYALYRQQEAG